jgi:hypothetical protein
MALHLAMCSSSVSVKSLITAPPSQAAPFSSTPSKAEFFALMYEKLSWCAHNFFCWSSPQSLVLFSDTQDAEPEEELLLAMPMPIGSGRKAFVG